MTNQCLNRWWQLSAKRMVLIKVTSLYGKTSAIDTVDGSSTGIAMCKIAFFLRYAESLLMWLHSDLPGAPKVGPEYPPASDLAGSPNEGLKVTQRRH